MHTVVGGSNKWEQRLFLLRVCFCFPKYRACGYDGGPFSYGARQASRGFSMCGPNVEFGDFGVYSVYSGRVTCDVCVGSRGRALLRRACTRLLSAGD